MPHRPRILLLEGASHTAGSLLGTPLSECDLVRAEHPANFVDLLRSGPFDAVFTDARDASVIQWATNLFQAERVLEELPDGVAVVSPDLRILWANGTFDGWCHGPARNRGFYDALDSPEILGPDYSPFHTALGGRRSVTRLHGRDERYLELQVMPIAGATEGIVQLISLLRDVTGEVQQQQKLDALHQAGQDLASLSPDLLSHMSVEERIEMLKINIRRLTHELLHYDVIEIRLLDPSTGRLEPLLDEGMTTAAAQRALYPSTEGNGVTGFVAATGKSYLCPDTANDPLYIEGSEGARSSLTVPIIAHDEVLGTFNVESPKLGAFTEQDVQFAEIFSRELAAALHTLELLTAEKRSTASQSIEAISREVALPVDEILSSATAVLDRYIGHDPDLSDKLRQILAAARLIKQCIQKVGADLAPPQTGAGTEDPHARLRGLRVLVADCDERVRRSAHALLGRFGCVVETGRSGQEALTMARLSPYDAILVDIRLPDMTGYEAFQRLRQAQPAARIILMTAFGYDPSHAIVKCRQEGLRSVLYKPFRVDQLADALDRLDAPPAETPKDGKERGGS